MYASIIDTLSTVTFQKTFEGQFITIRSGVSTEIKISTTVGPIEQKGGTVGQIEQKGGTVSIENTGNGLKQIYTYPFQGSRISGTLELLTTENIRVSSIQTSNLFAQDTMTLEKLLVLDTFYQGAPFIIEGGFNATGTLTSFANLVISSFADVKKDIVMDTLSINKYLHVFGNLTTSSLNVLKTARMNGTVETRITTTAAPIRVVSGLSTIGASTSLFASGYFEAGDSFTTDMRSQSISTGRSFFIEGSLSTSELLVTRATTGTHYQASTLSVSTNITTGKLFLSSFSTKDLYQYGTLSTPTAIVKNSSVTVSVSTGNLQVGFIQTLHKNAQNTFVSTIETLSGRGDRIQGNTLFLSNTLSASSLSLTASLRMKSLDTENAEILSSVNATHLISQDLIIHSTFIYSSITTPRKYLETDVLFISGSLLAISNLNSKNIIVADSYKVQLSDNPFPPSISFLSTNTINSLSSFSAIDVLATRFTNINQLETKLANTSGFNAVAEFTIPFFRVSSAAYISYLRVNDKVSADTLGVTRYATIGKTDSHNGRLKTDSAFLQRLKASTIKLAEDLDVEDITGDIRANGLLLSNVSYPSNLTTSSIQTTNTRVEDITAVHLSGKSAVLKASLFTRDLTVDTFRIAADDSASLYTNPNSLILRNMEIGNDSIRVGQRQSIRQRSLLQVEGTTRLLDVFSPSFEVSFASTIISTLQTETFYGDHIHFSKSAGIFNQEGLLGSSTSIGVHNTLFVSPSTMGIGTRDSKVSLHVSGILLVAMRADIEQANISSLQTHSLQISTSYGRISLGTGNEHDIRLEGGLQMKNTLRFTEGNILLGSNTTPSFARSTFAIGDTTLMSDFATLELASGALYYDIIPL